MLACRWELGADMTTVGFIGSGNIGGTVARLATAAGYDVVLSNSRGPETLKDLVDDLGPRARAATAAEAAAAGDLLVVSIPVKGYADLSAAPAAGTVVMDTGNYYPQRDGQIAELDDGSGTSSELLARQLPGARVVKVFNNIYSRHLASLARPAGEAARSALPIAGDDPAAKEAVVAFLDAIGFDAVDAGPLGAGGRTFEPGTSAYGAPYGSFADDQGTPAGVAALRSALASS
jgi:predicted dinucleotide-binding enzyme